MAFKIAVISTDSAGFTALAAYGEATARDFPTQDHTHFEALLGPDWASRRISLDFDAVPYLDSSAIGWLLHSQKKLRDAGGRLVLHSVQPHIRNILSMLKIEKVVPITADASSAQKLLADRPRKKQTA